MLLLARSDSTFHSAMSSGCPSGCPWQEARLDAMLPSIRSPCVGGALHVDNSLTLNLWGCALNIVMSKLFSRAFLLQWVTLLATPRCRLSVHLSVANFFSPFFTSKIFVHTFTFYAFLDVSCHPELEKQGETQCHQAFSFSIVGISWWWPSTTWSTSLWSGSWPWSNPSITKVQFSFCSPVLQTILSAKAP